MAINYKYKIENETLKVESWGIDDNIEDVENYASSILELSINNDCKKVFCDERNLQYSLSVIDTFELAEKASVLGKVLKKIAIVCHENYLEDGRFYETVALNRGLKVFVTTDIEHANKWLE
jgi:hypothetical protein